MKPLLSPEVVAATAEIRIHSAGELAARLARGADGSWCLPDHWEMPVNMDNLGRLISRLTEVDVVRFVTARAERLARLEPDSSAIAFHPEGDAAAPLLTIRLGKRADSGGMYLQFDDEPVAYLASEAVFPSTSPDSWTERRFMPFAAEDIRAINLVFDGEGEPLAEIRLERPAAGAGFILPPGSCSSSRWRNGSTPSPRCASAPMRPVMPGRSPKPPDMPGVRFLRPSMERPGK